MNASKAKGTKWESEIVRYLIQSGWPHAERRALNGAKDKGDIAGIPGLVVEAKNENRVSLSTWVDEAEVEGENFGTAVAAVWAHRKGRGSAADGYVVMTGEQFVALLKMAGF